MTTQEPGQQIIDEFVGVSHGDFARVKELLAQYPMLVNARATWHETPIEAAAQMGREDIVDFLLAAGAPLDICTAAMLGMRDKVAEMLQADPELAHATGAHGIPVTYFPMIHSHGDIAELLVSEGADINAGEGTYTALHGAVLFGQKGMVEWLLERGVEVNPKNFDGKTPLDLAVERDQTEIAELLRAHGGIRVE